MVCAWKWNFLTNNTFWGTLNFLQWGAFSPMLLWNSNWEWLKLISGCSNVSSIYYHFYTTILFLLFLTNWFLLFFIVMYLISLPADVRRISVNSDRGRRGSRQPIFVRQLAVHTGALASAAARAALPPAQALSCAHSPSATTPGKLFALTSSEADPATVTKGLMWSVNIVILNP